MLIFFYFSTRYFVISYVLHRIPHIESLKKVNSVSCLKNCFNYKQVCLCFQLFQKLLFTISVVFSSFHLLSEKCLDACFFYMLIHYDAMKLSFTLQRNFHSKTKKKVNLHEIKIMVLLAL